MDSSTIIFVLILLIAFVFLRWFIDSDEEDLDALASNNVRVQPPPRNHREVTTDMIEVVQSIAPTLSVGQIRLDLERTGSVQETVDRILSGAQLPFPAGERTVQEDQTDERNRTNNIKPENLLEKFGINADATGVSSQSSRHQTLQEKKAEMILRARKRLEAQLKNEQDLTTLE